MKERRQNMRVNSTLVIDHWPWRSLLLSSSTAENISSSGICFPSLQRFESPQQIGISMHIPEFKEPITATAEVVWLKEIDSVNYRYQIGAKFLKISPAHRVRLLHHLCNKLEACNPQ
jgi:Tfp pilus assembly protein PilZ